MSRNRGPVPPAFVIDIEASGLGPGSFPIEIAWSDIDGGNQGAALIRPPTIGPSGSWDDLAEALHGISLDQLLRQGEPADQVTRRFVRATDGGRLFSDARFQDGIWLELLFDTLWPPVSLPPVHDILELVAPNDRGRLAVSLATATRPHRAMPDVALILKLVQASAVAVVGVDGDAAAVPPYLEAG